MMDKDFGDVSIPVFMLDDTILGGQLDNDGVPLSAGEYAVDIMYDAHGNITGGMLKAVTWDQLMKNGIQQLVLQMLL